MARQDLDYQDPVIAKLISYLDKTGPTKLRGRWLHGDVLHTPKYSLPLGYIAKENLNIYPADNMEDEHYMPVQMGIIYDWTNDIGQTSKLVRGVTSLYDIIEGRTADYQLNKNSIAYIIRSLQQFDEKAWISVGPNEQLSVEYGIGVDKRGPNVFSVEAILKFAIKLHLPRPGLE